MTFATLVFGRVKVPMVQIGVDGTTRYLRQSEAEDHYQAHVVAPKKAVHEEALAEYKRALRDFDKHVSITEGVEVRRDTGGLRKTRVLVDEVTIGLKTHEVE